MVQELKIHYSKIKLHGISHEGTNLTLLRSKELKNERHVRMKDDPKKAAHVGRGGQAHCILLR
jgi:hypothetical protein